MADDQGAVYDAAVRAAEADYTAAYEAAYASHVARVATSEALLDSDITPARQARDAAVAAALADYDAALGIVRRLDATDLPDDVIAKFDGDAASSEEGQA